MTTHTGFSLQSLQSSPATIKICKKSLKQLSWIFHRARSCRWIKSNQLGTAYLNNKTVINTEDFYVDPTRLWEPPGCSFTSCNEVSTSVHLSVICYSPSSRLHLWNTNKNDRELGDVPRLCSWCLLPLSASIITPGQKKKKKEVKEDEEKTKPNRDKVLRLKLGDFRMRYTSHPCTVNIIAM